jgi:hypothetical protein
MPLLRGQSMEVGVLSPLRGSVAANCSGCNDPIPLVHLGVNYAGTSFDLTNGPLVAVMPARITEGRHRPP